MERLDGEILVKGEEEARLGVFAVGKPGNAVLARIHQKKLEHWADPMRTRPGEINRNDGGRGVYFPDPDGHSLEVLTRPYGSGG